MKLTSQTINTVTKRPDGHFFDTNFSYRLALGYFLQGGSEVVLFSKTEFSKAPSAEVIVPDMSKRNLNFTRTTKERTDVASHGVMQWRSIGSLKYFLKRLSTRTERQIEVGSLFVLAFIREYIIFAITREI